MQPQMQTQVQPSISQTNRTPTEQGQLQFQNMSYSTTPNTGTPLQMGGQPSQANPQMLQQMYAQNPSMQAEIQQQMQAQLQQQGLNPGRILEGNRNQSDKEILQKLKVTKIALDALKGLKRNYGGDYSKHIDDVKQKIKYFSGYVMKGDPIKKLKVLERKLKKANSLIQHKKRHKIKKRKKKKKRKLFIKSIGNLFKKGLQGVGQAAKDAELKALLLENPNPPMKTILRITGFGKTIKTFFKKHLKIRDMNKEILLTGVLGLEARIKGFFLLKKYNLMASDFKKILKISPNYEPNLRKLNKMIKNDEKTLKKKQLEITKVKLKVKMAIAKNDQEFKMYLKTTKVPKGNAKRPKNKDINKLEANPNLDIIEFVGRNSIDCGFQLRSFIHSMANHSPLKEKYCKYVYKNFRKIKIKELRFYTKLAKKEMQSILAMKKSLYCGVCDATLQNNFDDKHKLILYSQRFCHDLISQYKDYIKFRHIILIQFYDQFFQLISCFEFKNEMGVDYPYRTMLETRKRRITSIKNCLNNLNTPQFYKYCYYVCSQFNLIKFSKFGTFKLLICSFILNKNSFISLDCSTN